LTGSSDIGGITPGVEAAMQAAGDSSFGSTLEGVGSMSKKARIVMFGEDADSHSQALSLLAEDGYDVARFPTAKETLLALKRSRADVVLLDLEADEIHATEIIRQAKSDNPEVSIILMGTPGAVESNPNMLLFGGYEYVLKPLHGEVLRTAIEQRLHQQHIYRICSTLSRAIDVDDTLDLILDTALRETGSSHGVILLVNGSSDSLRIETSKGLPDRAAGSTLLLDDAEILRFVIDNGEPIVLQGGFARLPFIPDHPPSGTGSSVCAPIRMGGRTIGVLNVNRPASARPFSQSDLRTIEIIGLQAAVAINQARAHRHALERQKLKHELDLARSIQQSLLPPTPNYGPWAQIEARSMPAHMIGGDFYDFAELGPDRLGLAIGDVAGKGVPGALLMVRAISNFRLRVSPDKTPGTILEELNNDLALNSTRGMHVTAIYAIFDFGRRVLQLSNAGHPCPFLGDTTACGPKSVDLSQGIPLGIMKDATFETTEIPLQPGGLAFFYTDGVVEAKGPGREEFSRARLESLLRRTPTSIPRLADAVLSELTAFTAGRPQHDDLTFVAVRMNASG